MKQLIDQSAHFTAAAAALVFAWVLGADFNLPSGALLGFGMGLIREITEDGSILTKGSLIDIFFWTIGGSVAGYYL